MSSLSLRDLLDADLAALSDCDDADDSELYATSSDGTVTFEDSIFSSDVTDEIKSPNEWQLLIESSEQAEQRFESMRISLSDDFSRAGEHQRFEAKPAVSLRSQASSDISNHDSTISWCVNDFNVSSKNLRLEYLMNDMRYSEGQEDEDLRTEVIELMNSMIEAVLGSALIIGAPLLQLKLIPQVIDWSLLPQMLQDDNTIYDAVVSCSDLNLASEITYDVGDNEEPKNVFERKNRLKVAECNLLLIFNQANESAVQRKIELLERRRCMEDELGLYKKEKSSVRMFSLSPNGNIMRIIVYQNQFYFRQTSQ